MVSPFRATATSYVAYEIIPLLSGKGLVFIAFLTASEVSYSFPLKSKSRLLKTPQEPTLNTIKNGNIFTNLFEIEYCI